jgi:3-dehydroquinate dehydratase-2
MRIVIVHGPSLNLLVEREGGEKGVDFHVLEQRIRNKAAELNLSIKTFQSNHEGQLIDFLHAERHWADGVIISPGALAHTSYALRDALVCVDKPTLEVHLTDIRRRESWRRKSVLKDVCAGQVLGKGVDSYLYALQRFAEGDLTGRKRSRRTAAPPEPRARASSPEQTAMAARPPAAASPRPNGATSLPGNVPVRPERRPESGVSASSSLTASGSVRPERRPQAGAEGPPPSRPPAPAPKTLGRKLELVGAPAHSLGENLRAAAAGSPEVPVVNVLSRALVREKIAERLAGQLSPAGLATWARGQWLEVQRGAPAESGQRELLEDSLQALVLAAMPASRLSDEQLVDMMAQLET